MYADIWVSSPVITDVADQQVVLADAFHQADILPITGDDTLQVVGGSVCCRIVDQENPCTVTAVIVCPEVARIGYRSHQSGRFMDFSIRDFAHGLTDAKRWCEGLATHLTPENATDYDWYKCNGLFPVPHAAKIQINSAKKHFPYLCPIIAAQMKIHQFYDDGLAHASYAILSDGVIALIDPARDPQPYLDFAGQYHARISAIVETHPHADFVSSHAELHYLTGATIYTSRLVGAEYPHRPFDDGDRIALGNVYLEAINTPGHSPDSICVLLRDEQRQPYAVFTGDTLFVGDVGRPDLRENVGNITANATALARQLYHSLRDKLMTLPPDVLVYPAHGPGSLCGKQMGNELQSTIAKEIRGNHALQAMDEDEFVALVTEQQPFIPPYFEYDVTLNKKGADGFKAGIDAIPVLDIPNGLVPGVTIIDGRPQAQFRVGHLPHAISIPDGLRFETWLGTVVRPGESFYLLAGDTQRLQTLIEKAAKIGYEQQIKGKSTITEGPVQSAPFDAGHFMDNQGAYTIVDIRNRQEVELRPIFDRAINVPLPELRDRVGEIPLGKPIAVHCAGGYRSAIGSSIIAAALPGAAVQDIGSHISEFTPID